MLHSVIEASFIPSHYGRAAHTGGKRRTGSVNGLKVRFGSNFSVPSGPANGRNRRNLAIGAGIAEGPQSTRKLSCPELKTFDKFSYPLPVKGLQLP
jgi:hypothetical protein